MMFFLLLSGLFFSVLIYCFVIFYFLDGWNQLKEFIHENKDFKSEISVIVAVRNEESNISLLLSDLMRQTLDKKYYEVIIVNDNSTDTTVEIVENEIKNQNNFSLINNKKENIGKKNAIRQGVLNSKNQLIVTTDADCRLPENWLITILDFYEKHSPVMISAPVIIEQSEKIFSFSKIQSLEFLSLVVSGAGAASKQRPIMCNAANMAFEKNVFLEFDNIQNENTVSGDDVFLLMNIKKKYKGKIKFLKSLQATVYTKAQNNLKDFINQRIRWTSKSKNYSDKEIIFVSIIVFLANFSLLTTLILGVSDFNYFLLFIFLFFIKILPDFFILKSASEYFKLKNFKFLFFPVQFLYIWYVVFIAIFGNFLNFSWKSRIFKQIKH